MFVLLCLISGSKIPPSWSYTLAYNILFIKVNHKKVDFICVAMSVVAGESFGYLVGEKLVQI